MKYEITEEQERASKYRTPNQLARAWYWMEYVWRTEPCLREPTGNKGCLRASTEMEAIDRLREAFPTIGAIKWISQAAY